MFFETEDVSDSVSCRRMHILTPLRPVKGHKRQDIIHMQGVYLPALLLTCPGGGVA